MNQSQPTFTIRPIEAEDDAAMAKIIQEVMTEFGASGEGYSINDAEVQAMYAAYRSPRCAYFVLDVGGAIVGGAGIAPLQGAEATVCELKKMYFLPSARGLGAGCALLDVCLSQAKQLGYTQCYLETLSNMSSAQRLYKVAGFTQIEKAMGATGHFGCNTFFVREL